MHHCVILYVHLIHACQYEEKLRLFVQIIIELLLIATLVQSFVHICTV